VIRLLLVDDHDELRRSLQIVLGALFPAMTFDHAASAAEAMALAERGAFDVVLLDLSLPDRSGMATLRDLRRLRPALPVVVMSFHPEAEFMIAARAAGAAAYVTKGSPTEAIERAVRTALGSAASKDDVGP
jgi:DNA-binding NarL/FixJ family response regulator